MTQWNNSFQLGIEQVWIDRAIRQRREIETDDLEHSISQRGLIQPIVVELTEPDLQGTKPPFKLIAGERRLTACQRLGHTHIEAREVLNLAPIERELIELEENIKRMDLTWQEISDAVAKVHQLHLSQDTGWTMGETAEVCGLTISTISLYLRVQAEMKTNVRVAEAGTAREAYNIVTRRDARSAGAALEELIAPPAPRSLAQIENPAPGTVSLAELPSPTPRPLVPASAKPPSSPLVSDTILHTSFLDWAPQYDGPRFNFIHMDFPYGIDFSSGPQGLGSEESTYSDGKEIYFRLLDCLFDNLDRLAGVSAHIVFWYSERHGQVTRELFEQRASGFKRLLHPLIWLKSDNAGIAPDAKRTPRHIYETAMVFVKGDRQLVRVKSDAYSAPTNKLLHPSTKPEPMLRHFFEMFVDDYTQMLDPTCGSGASLRAAESLGAKSVLGLEIDPQYVAPARKALEDERKKRAAAKIGNFGL